MTDWSEKWAVSCSAASDSLQPRGRQPTKAPPPSMEFLRQDYGSGLPFPSPGWNHLLLVPSPGNLPDPGIKSESPPWQQILYLPSESSKYRQNSTHSVFKTHHSCHAKWRHGFLISKTEMPDSTLLSTGSSKKIIQEKDTPETWRESTLYTW